MAVRFTLTPRLMTVGAVSIVGLLLMLFLLGLQLGRMWGTEEGRRQALLAAAQDDDGEDGDAQADDPSKPHKLKKPRIPSLVRKAAKPFIPKP